jgi:WD40 repeat protein
VGDPVQVVNFNPVLAYTPNGKTLAASVSGTLVNLYDVSGDRPREFAALAGHTRPVVAIVFAPDGKIAATAGADGVVRLWDVSTARELKSFPLPNVRSLSFSPKGNQLAVAGDTLQGNADLRLLEWTEEGWTDATPTWKKSLAGHLMATAFTPDGEMLFAAGSDGTVVLFNLFGGLNHSWNMGGPVRDLSVANDGRHVAIANGNGTVCILRYRPVPPRG